MLCDCLPCTKPLIRAAGRDRGNIRRQSAQPAAQASLCAAARARRAHWSSRAACTCTGATGQLHDPDLVRKSAMAVSEVPGQRLAKSLKAESGPSWVLQAIGYTAVNCGSGL